MTFSVILMDSARFDFADVFNRIARESPSAADNWMEGLFQAIDTLEKFPRRFGLALEQKHFGGDVRHMLYRSHRIIYRVDEDTVAILHIRHSAMRPIGWRGEREE